MPFALRHQKALESISTDWNPSETIGSHLTNYIFCSWLAGKRKRPPNQHFHTETAAF
jgi:hypothetical protein